MSGRRALTLAAVVLFWSARAALAQPGSISGVVVKWPSGEPVAGAVVKLTDEAPAEAPPGFQLQSTTAAADGSFRFDNIEPHDYYVVANAQGYLPAEYGQRSPTGTGVSFPVRSGQRVMLRLTAWATSGIAGRVVDADGDPVGRAQVLALRLVYRDGKPSMTIAQTVMTNDRGEYKMVQCCDGTFEIALPSGTYTTRPRRFGEERFVGLLRTFPSLRRPAGRLHRVCD